VSILEETYFERQITVERIERNVLSENSTVLRLASAICAALPIPASVFCSFAGVFHSGAFQKAGPVSEHGFKGCGKTPCFEGARLQSCRKGAKLIEGFSP
jgi:hypothetical protein